MVAFSGENRWYWKYYPTLNYFRLKFTNLQYVFVFVKRLDTLPDIINYVLFAFRHEEKLHASIVFFTRACYCRDQVAGAIIPCAPVGAEEVQG